MKDSSLFKMAIMAIAVMCGVTIVAGSIAEVKAIPKSISITY